VMYSVYVVMYSGRDRLLASRWLAARSKYIVWRPCCLLHGSIHHVVIFSWHTRTARGSRIRSKGRPYKQVRRAAEPEQYKVWPTWPMRRAGFLDAPQTNGLTHRPD
jgi:hypothetical protein